MSPPSSRRFVVVCTSIICVPLGLLSLVVGVVGIPGHISGNKAELVVAGMMLFLTPLTIAMSMVCCEERTRPANVPAVVTHKIEISSSTNADIDMVSVMHPHLILEDNTQPTTSDHPLPVPFYEPRVTLIETDDSVTSVNS